MAAGTALLLIDVQTGFDAPGRAPAPPASSAREIDITAASALHGEFVTARAADAIIAGGA